MSRDTCDPCKFNEKLNQAVLWCMQCEESLCVDCAQNHKLMKILRHHKLVDIHDAPNFFNPPNECQKHGNLELDFYCFDHETLCCKECLMCSHRLCEKVLTVELASSDIQQIKMVTECADRMKVIQSTLQTTLMNRTKNVEDVESEIEVIKEKTSATKETFMKHLESLEQQLLSGLDKAGCLHLQKINEDIKVTKTNIATIEEKNAAFEWTKKHGSDKQMFRLIHTLHKDISDIEDRVEKLTSNVVSISFKPSTERITEQPLSIGSFKVKETLQNIEFPFKRLRQCQFLAPCQPNLLENVSYTTVYTSNSIYMQWYTFSKDDSVSTYIVQCRNGEKMLERIKTKHPRIKLLHLQPNTKYQIEVIAEREHADQYTLLNSIISTTYPKVIEEILKCTNISGNCKSKVNYTLEGTNPTIYCLKPVKEEFIAESKNVRKCSMISEISSKDESFQNQKTIIVMGASGSGKTTFIDAMFNYMVGVSYDSDHRFKIVNLTDSERKKLGHQCESQTEVVTWYTVPVIEGPQMNCIFNIIDTPGFEDTRGEDYDEEIPRMIEILFSKGEGIESLDAICLVEKLSVNRLTQRQEYIFKSVTKIFGKDIADNMFACLTFDDGGEAHVLKAFEQAGMSYLDKVHFRFNNSDIFSRNQDLEMWSKRRQSFENFFKQLSKVPKKSLRTTKAVLTSRSSLKSQLTGIQQNLRNQVQNISNIEKRRQMVQDCQMDIESNRNFTFTEITSRTERIEKDLDCLNCPKCKKTCHLGCSYGNWANYMCEIMHWNGKCKLCECKNYTHVNERFEYREVFEEVETTLMEIFERYQSALNEKSNQTDILSIEEDTLRNSFKNLVELLGKIQNLIKQLNSIALTPDTFSLKHYITHVIRIEVCSNEHGSEKRIALLQNINEVIKKMDGKINIFNELCEAFTILPSPPNNENCFEGTCV